MSDPGFLLLPRGMRCGKTRQNTALQLKRCADAGKTAISQAAMAELGSATTLIKHATPIR
jgi:hypothetical protein